MDLTERESRVKEWVTQVHEAEQKLWPDVRSSPSWGLKDWNNYLDAHQLWPRTNSGKLYHQAFDLGLAADEMANIAWATRLGDEDDFRRAIEAGVPASYMLELNEAYQDRLTADGINPGPYPAFFHSRLYDAEVPAEYAAALLRSSAPVPSAIIAVYEQGIPVEFAMELDLESLGVATSVEAGDLPPAAQ